MTDLQRDSPLFDQFLKVHLTDGIHDGKDVNLVFRIIQGTQPTLSGGNTEKVFHFEITDERDPYFLYYMNVGEQDFHSLKRDQSILVDFNVFPLKLIELIQLCLQNAANKASDDLGNFENCNSDALNKSTDSTPMTATAFDNSVATFVAKLDTSGENGVLSLVEANKFKQLTHISLVMKPGDDAAIKHYLASRLSLTLDLSAKQAREIQTLQDKLGTESSQNNTMNHELLELRSQRNVDLQSIKSNHTQELSLVQKQAMDSVDQTRSKYEELIQSLRSELETVKADLQVKTTTSEQKIADLQHDKGTLDFKIRDLSRTLETTEADRDRILAECREMSDLRKTAEEEKMAHQHTIVRLESKVEGLMQQLTSRDESNQKSMALLKASEDARQNIDEQLRRYVASTDNAQEQLTGAMGEIDRGNELIARLQAEGRSLKDKIKIKSEVIRRQEVVVMELRGKLSETEGQVSHGKESCAGLGQQVSSLQKQLQNAEGRLQESSKLIASNAEVITYLNEEINKWQLGMRVTAEMPSMPSSHQRYGTGRHVVTPSSHSLHGTAAYGSSGKKEMKTSPGDGASAMWRAPTSSSPPYHDDAQEGAGNARMSYYLHEMANNNNSNRNYNQKNNPNHVSSSSTSSQSVGGVHTEGDSSHNRLYMQGIKNLGLSQDLQAELLLNKIKVGKVTETETRGGGGEGVLPSETKPRYDWQSEGYGLEDVNSQKC